MGGEGGGQGAGSQENAGDSMSAPLRELSQMLEHIRTGLFCPGGKRETRSGRWKTPLETEEWTPTECADSEPSCHVPDPASPSL
eukprot:3824751-Amphidinium_carterae.1